MSDVDILQKLSCEASAHETEDKQKLWDSYVKGEKMNNRQFKASADCFYNHEDPEQCTLFATQFFKVVEKVFKEHHRDYAEVFFTSLNPTFLGIPHYIEEYKQILARASATENTHFINLLKDEIYQLEEIIQIKKQA